MSDFVLADAINGRDITVVETIGELTGTIRYHLHSEHAHGDIAFFPSWYTSYDSSPQDFYVASTARGTTRGVLDRGSQLRIHGAKVDFFYAGTRDETDPAGPGYRELESHIWLPETRLENSVARQRVTETAHIMRQLIDTSLSRPDMADLRHIADLAAADMRNVFEQWRFNELHALIDDYTQQRAEAERRAGAFASQAHVYRRMCEEHRAQQTSQRPHAADQTQRNANTPTRSKPKPGRRGR